MAKINHFLDLRHLKREQLRAILDRAHHLKKGRQDLMKGQRDGDATLSGHVLAMIFEKSSTRTRISFDMAMCQLGGSSILLNGSDMQLGRGETIEDTAKVLSRYVDAIMLRSKKHQTLLDLANAAEIPVINGLTNLTHPCQIVADLMTYEEHAGPIEQASLTWVGDGNNVANSFIEAAGIFGFRLNLACPISLGPDKTVMDWANANGANIHIMKDPVKAVKGAKAVVTDTWVSMGDKHGAAKKQMLAPFQVTENLMSQADKGAIFMHCLPAHRGQEMTAAVIDGDASVVFDEAENRVYAQKAILEWCFGKI